MTTVSLPPPMRLVNSNRATGQTKWCDQHKAMVPPEGGIQFNPNKWMCASCWVKFNARRRAK